MYKNLHTVRDNRLTPYDGFLPIKIGQRYTRRRPGVLLHAKPLNGISGIPEFSLQV